MNTALLEAAERGWIPDPVLRHGIRVLLRERLHEIRSAPESAAALVERMRQGPLAIDTRAANAQHYEVPAAFFEAVLGRHLKYSSGYWPPGTDSLDEAESAALDLACARAGVEDGMQVLDLGCGWGSLALWIARRYPGCLVSAVSNSRSQGAFIMERVRARNLRNVAVHVADLNDFQPDRTFDRVISIEMFEHMRNYARLLDRVAHWLGRDGRLFVHVFCHRSQPYFFEDRGPGDWMARHFFTGGVMPSETLMDHFAGPVRLEQRWRLSGTHYERTARAWLANLDYRANEVRAILATAHGADADRWLRRWRLFFLACAELFGYDGGEEWFVSHSLWSRGRIVKH
ncbi:MAG: class I SAM-dependent methyltransferase [Acidobacteria bacterium]|nr:class I SAM-dependent methyltransferase [Acidobacteriota bacterium]